MSYSNTDKNDKDVLEGLGENVKKMFHGVLKESINPSEIRKEIVSELEETLKKIKKNLDGISNDNFELCENTETIKKNSENAEKHLKCLDTADTTVKTVRDNIYALQHEIDQVSTTVNRTLASFNSKTRSTNREIKGRFAIVNNRIKSTRDTLHNIEKRTNQLTSTYNKTEALLPNLQDRITDLAVDTKAQLEKNKKMSIRLMWLQIGASALFLVSAISNFIG
jgi:chromosome segregation ATPase